MTGRIEKLTKPGRVDKRSASTDQLIADNAAAKQNAVRQAY